eukprot:jgi/Chrzof1/10860/Cz05g15030.t1
MPPAKKQEQIPITALSPAELASIRERVEADFERLAEYSVELQRLIAQFGASGRSIETLAESKQGKADIRQPLLLPLTSSLYVPGALAETEKVLIDIGTGYYVEMSSEEGTDYCRRKVLKLKDQLDIANQAAQEKKNFLLQVNAVLQQKVKAGQAQQKAS